MPTSIHNYSYATAARHHYTHAEFLAKIAPKIIGSNSITWATATGQQSCAMRVSIALAYAGLHWRQVRNSWRLKETNVYFPSRAGDYPILLANGEAVADQQAIAGRHGVVFFGGGFNGASGHVTLWDGQKCHYNDAYWAQPVKYFWEMS